MTWTCPRCPNSITLHINPSEPPLCTRHTPPTHMEKHATQTPKETPAT